MKLYWVGTHYVRTQGEAKKLGFGEETDVPTTDKDEFIRWVNAKHTEWTQKAADTAYVDDAPSEELAKVAFGPEPGMMFGQGDKPAAVERQALEEPPRAMDASSVLSRMDNPKLDLDAVIERIAQMKGGHALKRVAGAVAMRFEELSK